MANLDFIKPYPALERHRQQVAAAQRARRIRLALGLPIALTLTALSIWINPMLALPVAGLSAVILFFASLTGGSDVDSGQLIGIEGEVRTLRFLSDLDDRFTIFNRLRLPDPTLPNGQRELDFVVLACGRLWVIEVKNLPGVITVQPDRARWPIQQRAGCGSAPGWRQMDNPLRQLQAQTAALERWLLTHGLHYPVDGLVCFARPGVGLQAEQLDELPVTLVDSLKPRLEKMTESAVETPAHLPELLAKL